MTPQAAATEARIVPMVSTSGESVIVGSVATMPSSKGQKRQPLGWNLPAREVFNNATRGPS